MIFQCNGSYRAESAEMLKFLQINQVKPTTTKKIVFSVQDQKHTVFRTSNRNHVAVDIHKKRGE